MNTGDRILYIDHLRIFLTALVVLHHLSITYGASGGWYYKEVEGDMFTTLVLTMFTATNQSFFMGLFFLISAYFTKISVDRKPLNSFVKSRLLRLGIPLVVYYFIISPLTIYIVAVFGKGADIGLLDFIRTHYAFGFGPLWFVETLIYFSFIYVIYQWFWGKKKSQPARSLPFPKNKSILFLILFVSSVSYLVRLKFRLGTEIPYTGLQLPYFPQYIAMLILGILFAKYRWFEKVTYIQGLKWLGIAQIFILVVFPLFYLLSNHEGDPYAGGLTWESAVLSLWEQIVGISLMIGVVGIFKEKLNAPNKVANLLSGAAYGVFIIHSIVIVCLSLSLRHWDIYPVLKFIVLSPISLILCFGVAIALKKVPGFNKVL